MKENRAVKIRKNARMEKSETTPHKWSVPHRAALRSDESSTK